MVAHPRSTRTRLTFYFTAVFGIMVVCLAMGSYLVVRHEAYTELDASLSTAVSATAMSFTHELAEHSKQQDGEQDEQYVLDAAPSSSLPDMQILIRDANRNVAHKSVQAPVFDLRDVSTSSLLSTSSVPNVRIASREFDEPKFNVHYHIFAATSIVPTAAKLGEFRGVLFICIPLGLALAALAGYALAQRSLAPLDQLTRIIEGITSTDLSARVKLQDAPSDFEWLASRFNSLLDRLETAFHMQRRFMADASHELRTPLTVALSAAQVTARDPNHTVADCEEALSLVEEQILRLGGIVENMLFLSQVDADSLCLEDREFYLDDAISEAARAARALARPRQQTLRIEQLPEALCVGDQNLFKQAIIILLDNAVKYTQPGGEIAISLVPCPEHWSCRVWNNGPAIPVDLQTRIFERFYRAANGLSEKTSGSGLGLPIARTIAESHGGALNLLHSDSGGTTFELTMPAAKELLADNRCDPKSLAVKI